MAQKMKILAIFLVSAALFNLIIGLSHEHKTFRQTLTQSLQEVCSHRNLILHVHFIKPYAVADFGGLLGFH